MIAATVLVYLALAVTSAATLAPWWDEAWFSNPALNLARSGHMGTDILDPSGWLAGVNTYTYWVPPLYLVALAGWIKLLGFGVFRIRLLSALWGLVALVAWYVVMRRLSNDRRVALLAFVLIAVEYSFISMASEARMDMMSVALGAAALAVYLSLRERSLARALVLGHALAAASMLTHPNGAFGVLGLIWLGWTRDRDRMGWGHAALALAPYAAGLAGWGLYIAHDPSDFARQIGGNTLDRFHGLQSPLDALAGEVSRYVRFYAYGPNWAESRFRLLARPVRAWPLVMPLMYLAGTVTALFIRDIRRHPGYSVVLLLALAGGLGLAFMDTHKRFYYLVYVMPLYAAVVAALAVWAWDRRVVPGWVPSACVAVLVAGSLALDLRQLRLTPARTGYTTTIRWLRQHVTDRSLVMGSAELAFGLGFGPRVQDDYTLGCWSGRRPDLIVVGVRYRERLQDLDEPPRVHAFMVHRLSVEYQPVFEAGSYRVYAPRPSPSR